MGGTLAPGTGGIDRLDFYYEDGLAGPITDTNSPSFANSIRIVPEPTGSLVLATLSSAALASPDLLWGVLE